MEQLRLGLPPRDAANPLARLLFGMIALVGGLGVLAVVLFVVLPLAGIIVSAAVGGAILALAGLVMMIPSFWSPPRSLSYLPDRVHVVTAAFAPTPLGVDIPGSEDYAASALSQP